MNTKNNKRRRKSREKIESVFIDFLQTREINKISVTEICEKAGLNRSTFYANYLDVYDLADKIRERLESEMPYIPSFDAESFGSAGFLALFRHIEENQDLYKTYFKLGYDEKFEIPHFDSEFAKTLFDDGLLNYHIEFFKSGLTRIIKLWLENGCKQSPEEIAEVIKSEYSHRKFMPNESDE